MLIQTWSEVLTQSFKDLWLGVIDFVPNLIIALVIFIIGWIIGAVLGRVVDQIIRSLKVDNALRGAGLDDAFGRAGFDLNSGRFLGGLVKWFIIIVFLVASLDVLGLTQVNTFLQEVVLLYLPQVIVAVLILLVVQTLFTGVVVALALAIGLSFGLGGQDAAGRYIDKLRGDISEKN